jgi:hypothetical protein
MGNMASSLGSWLLRLFRDVVELFRLALKLPLAAPVIFAVVVLPEFVQHIVEIHFGMFAAGDSLAPGRETEIRMAFGIAKVVGLCLAVVLTMRFWASGGRLRAAFLPGLAQLRRIALVIGFLLILGLPDLILQPEARQVFDIVSALFAMFWLLWFLAALAGMEMTLARSIRKAIPTLPRMIILPSAAWIPLSWLHGALHVVARHRPEWLVWGLMTIDALVVGLLAAATGAAFFILVRGAADSDRVAPPTPSGGSALESPA